MAEEPQVIFILRIIFETIWTILLVNFQLLKAFASWVVPPEPKDVSEDIVLITGAGHGIGREMALRFARLGAVVVSADINEAGNEETMRMIKAEKGKVHTYKVDVTDRAAVFELADKVSKEVGDVTILVNNAGIMPCKPILKHSEKEIRSAVDININGNLWTIQAFLPAMLENNYGHIVCMSSMAGKMGLRNLVPYCGTKFAARGIMEALAMELHESPLDTSGIHLTTICPYIVNTGLCRRPRIRFEGLMKTVEPGDAAEQILNAVRRNYVEITVPSEFYYLTKLYNILPVNAIKAFVDFMQTGLDPHD